MPRTRRTRNGGRVCERFIHCDGCDREIVSYREFMGVDFRTRDGRVWWRELHLGMGNSVAVAEMTVAGIAAKIAQGARIGRDEARWLWVHASDEELRGMA